MKNTQMRIESANPFEGQVTIENEAVVSEGFGKMSIARIVEEHGGLSDFDVRDGLFVLRIIL